MQAFQLEVGDVLHTPSGPQPITEIRREKRNGPDGFPRVTVHVTTAAGVHDFQRFDRVDASRN